MSLLQAVPENAVTAVIDGAAIVGIVGAVLALLGVIATGFFAIKAKQLEKQLAQIQADANRELRVEVDLPQALIDQYQEMTKDLRDDVKTLTTRVSQLEIRADVYRSYAWQLIEHINAGNPPPPPAWPAGLA